MVLHLNVANVGTCAACCVPLRLGPRYVPQHRVLLHALGAKTRIVKANGKKGTFPRSWRGGGVCVVTECYTDGKSGERKTPLG